MSLEAVIDLQALTRNIRRLRDIASGSKTMLMVKANAYGHGLVPISRAAVDAGCEWLGVLDVEAGIDVRRAGINVPLFAWLVGASTDLEAASRHDIDLGISGRWQLERIERAKLDKPVHVHLKVDTGLHRNGATREDWPLLVDTAKRLVDQGVISVRGIWSHLADVSIEEDRLSLAQLHDAIRVAKERGVVPEIAHLAASSAGIRLPEARLDLVRFGIAVYGSSPFDDKSAKDLGLEQPMTLRSSVVSVDTERGVAYVDGGYGDGIHPAAEGTAEVLHRGVRRRVTRILARQTEIAVPDAGVNDEVTFFGNFGSLAPSVEEWGNWASSIGDEVFTSLRQHVTRTYVH